MTTMLASRRNCTLLACCVGGAVLLEPSSAAAFKCARLPNDGPSLHWDQRTITYAFNEAGTADIAGTAELDAIRAAFAAWESAQECASPGRSTDIVFVEQAMTTTTEVARDGVNLIVFRQSGWTYGPYIGITTTWFDRGGVILEVDTEYNDEMIDFTVSGTALGLDLTSAAVDQIGHMLGLAHSSEPRSSMIEPRPGDTGGRTLSCDDRDAIVFKYPAGDVNGYCDPPVAECGYCAPPDSGSPGGGGGADSSGSGGGGSGGLGQDAGSGGCSSQQPHTEACLLAIACAYILRGPNRRKRRV